MKIYQAVLILISYHGGAMAAPSQCSGTCPYTKDNLSWGEYQTKIRMPRGESSPYTVVIEFDAETTIGSCHSNCNDGMGQNKPSCVGTVCTVTYTGSGPMEMFNVKKADPASEKDRSNIISVTVNGKKQCGCKPKNCPYTKDNVSWGEYQTKIGMPGGVSPPYKVAINFDTETTIGSCHSNCNDGSGKNKPSCVGTVCGVTYTGSGPMEMFNVKKADPSDEKDRSNIISVTVNGVEQC